MNNESNFNNIPPPDTESSGCPYINISINDIEYEMLIDSGAEVSVISNKYEDRILNRNSQTPTLPLVGMSIHLAVGEKPTKVTKQILLPIKFSTNTIHAPFIVVNN